MNIRMTRVLSLVAAISFAPIIMPGCASKTEQRQMQEGNIAWGPRDLDYAALIRQDGKFNDFSGLADMAIAEYWPSAQISLGETDFSSFKTTVETELTTANPSLDIDSLKEFGLGKNNSPKPFVLPQAKIETEYQRLSEARFKQIQKDLTAAEKAKKTAEDNALAAIDAQNKATAKAKQAAKDLAAAEIAKTTAETNAKQLAAAPKVVAAPVGPDAGIIYIDLKPTKSVAVVIDLPEIPIEQLEDVTFTVEGAQVKLDPALSDLKEKKFYLLITADKAVKAGQTPIMVTFNNKDKNGTEETLSSQIAFKYGLQFTVPEIKVRTVTEQPKVDSVAKPKKGVCDAFVNDQAERAKCNAACTGIKDKVERGDCIAGYQ